MKRRVFIYIIILSFVVLSACSQQEIDNISLPERADITKVCYVAENEYKSIVAEGNIDNLILELSAINKKVFSSYQDTPQVKKYAEITFEMSTGISSNKVFIYKTKEGFFIEQPYNGIFLIKESQYQTIINAFNN